MHSSDIDITSSMSRQPSGDIIAHALSGELPVSTQLPDFLHSELSVSVIRTLGSQRCQGYDDKSAVPRARQPNKSCDKSYPVRSNSGPEPILPLLVALILTKLDSLSVFHFPDVHLGK